MQKSFDLSKQKLYRDGRREPTVPLNTHFVRARMRVRNTQHFAKYIIVDSYNRAYKGKHKLHLQCSSNDAFRPERCANQ